MNFAVRGMRERQERRVTTKIIPGLVSVTLRRLSLTHVVAFAKKGNLEAIEWTGQAHIAPGDVEAARTAATITSDAGLVVAGYGSYYRLGAPHTHTFDAVLDTAAALGAPTIRVFAGGKSSSKAMDTYWSKVAAQAVDIAEKAQAANLTISFEFQRNTLNDSVDGARHLFDMADHPALRSYWQPDFSDPPNNASDALPVIMSRLTNIHVFYWPGGKRAALDGAIPDWRYYVKVIRERSKRDQHYALLELVEGDLPENVVRDAGFLREILGNE